MKKITLVALCMLAVCGTAVAAQPSKAEKAAKSKLHSGPARLLPHKADAEKAPWCPLKQTDYSWMYEDESAPHDGEWVEEDSYELTYTPAGKEATKRTTTPDGEILLEVNTYNADNMLISRVVSKSEDEGETFEETERLTREYDPILKNVIISNIEQSNYGGQWYDGNCYKRIITRNADGNITECAIAVLFQGIYDPTRKLVTEYGSDGKACKITHSVLNYDYGTAEYYWETDMELTDIEWERTDGQIWNEEYLTSGANRISKGTFNNDGVISVMTFTYDGNNVDGRGTMDDPDDDFYNLIVTYTELPNGGYKNYTLTYNDAVSESETETEEYDAFGLLTLRKVEWTNFSWSEFYEYTEGAVRYDDVTGYPEQYTVTDRDLDEESVTYGEAIYRLKMTFEGQADLSGINDAVADADADAPVEYFNLQGIRVQHPAAGQPVIRRQGSRVSKVVVK